MKINRLFFLLTLGFLGVASVQAAEAAPRFTFTPATGSYGNGASFTVTLGIDSGTEKVVAADIAGAFDQTKLQLVSIDKIASPALPYDPNAWTPKIDNTNGKFDIQPAPLNMDLNGATTVSGPLMTLTFKAISPGTASVTLRCTQGALDDLNMINTAGKDVVDCASNQSGSYTITATGGADVGTTGTTVTPTPTSGTLPQTGGISTTIGLILVGLSSMIGALFLRGL